VLACRCPPLRLGATGQLLNRMGPPTPSTLAWHCPGSEQEGRERHTDIQARQGTVGCHRHRGPRCPWVRFDDLCLGAAAQNLGARQHERCVPSYLYLSAFPWRCEPPSLPLCAHTHAQAHAQARTRARTRENPLSTRVLTCTHVCSCTLMPARTHMCTQMHVHTRTPTCTHTQRAFLPLPLPPLPIRGQVPQASGLCLLLTGTNSRLLPASALVAEHR